MKIYNRRLKVASYTLVIGLIVLFTNCSGNGNSNQAEKVIETMPQELKDTAVLQADEENALNKLSNIIDTSGKK